MGINLDYLMDDDRNPLLTPRRPLADALEELGAKFLRYPGGWKSAINLWSTPPYDSSRPSLAGRVPENWIRAGLPLVAPDGGWRFDPLDFDEFIHLCGVIRAEPCIVVPYESCHWSARGDWKPPSRDRLLETAVAWVRYARRVRPASVKYWEVGNESWLNNETWTNRISPGTYATDLVEFARRMKAEDPTILIGANGNSDPWWQAVLGRAAEQIDFLSVHAYPCWKWTNYYEYLSRNPDPLGSVRTAAAAIAQYAPAHRQRLRIMVTEFAAGTFGPWDQIPADLGRALITFDLQGQLLQCPEVYFSQFWNTHNIYSDVDGGVFDVLKRDNTLTPVGRALSIWNQFLGEEMVATVSSTRVRCFATHVPGRQLVVFLLNKDTRSRSGRVVLRGTRLSHGERWGFHGQGPADSNPTWARIGSVRFTHSRITLRLEPVSLTMVLLKPESILDPRLQ
jgi:hypothetical protein